jgi:hypothetical protein
MAETPNPGRRQVLQVLAGSVGAGLAAPALAGDHASHARPAVPPVAVSEAPAAPGFLDPHQLETLASLAEAIVPGSTVAGVAPFVDRLLAVDTRETQTEFLAALGAIQAESVARYRKPWLELTPQQQTELLTAASTGPMSQPPRYWTPGEPVLAPEPPRAQPTLRDRFDRLKRWIATGYYSSEPGMKELGWTGQSIHPGFPECAHPGGHASGE